MVIRNRPPVTLILIGLCLLVALISSLGSNLDMLKPFLISAYLSPVLPEIKDGELWRLVTPMFLHFGIFHLIFNMMWMWDLGRLIESVAGITTLLVLVFSAGLAANIAQYFVSGPLFGGMSGVIFALLGYLWAQGHFNPNFGVKLKQPIVLFMLGWFVLCWTGILEWLFDIHVANTAHTAGLLVGLVIGFLHAKSSFTRTKH